MRSMLKNTINGLDEILFVEIPEGSVILVTGAEGTLKSGLVFSMMANHVAANDEHGSLCHIGAKCGEPPSQYE